MPKVGRWRACRVRCRGQRLIALDKLKGSCSLRLLFRLGVIHDDIKVIAITLGQGNAVQSIPLSSFVSPALVGLACVYAVAGPVVLLRRHARAQPSAASARTLWLRTAGHVCNAVALMIFGIVFGQLPGADSTKETLAGVLLTCVAAGLLALADRGESRGAAGDRARRPDQRQWPPIDRSLALIGVVLVAVVFLLAYAALRTKPLLDVQTLQRVIFGLLVGFNLLIAVKGILLLQQQPQSGLPAGVAKDPRGTGTLYLWIGGTWALAFGAAAIGVLSPVVALNVVAALGLGTLVWMFVAKSWQRQRSSRTR